MGKIIRGLNISHYWLAGSTNPHMLDVRVSFAELRAVPGQTNLSLERMTSFGRSIFLSYKAELIMMSYISGMDDPASQYLQR